MRKGHIYLISFKSGQKYVGQTVDIKERRRRYKNCDCDNQHRIKACLLKYGFNSCIFEVIEEVDLKLLNEREIYWIAFYKTYSAENRKYGLNLTKGGGGTLGRIVTIEQKQMMRARNIGELNFNYGKTHTDDVKKKLSELQKGNKIWVGRKHSEETKRKLSLHFTGKPGLTKGLKMTERQREHLSEIKSRWILDFSTGLYYKGLSEAAEALDMSKYTLKEWLNVNHKRKNKSTLQFV